MPMDGPTAPKIVNFCRLGRKTPCIVPPLSQTRAWLLIAN
jgi:hypothetical protein